MHASTAIRPLMRWLGGRVLPPLAYPVVRGPLRGKRFILRAAAGAGGGASVYINGVEPRTMKALLAILGPAQIVFDIGANIGYYTLLASQQVGPSGRVLAFEPLVRNLAYLHRHCVLNHAHNVTIVPVACAEESSIERFAVGADCATGHLSSESTGHRGTLIVATTAVDDVVSETGLTPDVMKVDVEGAEERVLLGAAKTLSRARPVLLLSTHSPSLRRACTDYLLRLGYRTPSICDEVEGNTELLFIPAERRPQAPALAYDA
ncbi:MAG: FkbM family methyltransferase [Gemmatimonadota bacterium]